MRQDTEGFTMTVSNPWLVAWVLLPALQYGGAIDWPLWLVFAPIWIQVVRFFVLLGIHIWEHADGD